MLYFKARVMVSKEEIVTDRESRVCQLSTLLNPFDPYYCLGVQILLCSAQTGAGRLTHLLYELAPYYLSRIHLHLWLSQTCPFLPYLSPLRMTLPLTCPLLWMHNPLLPPVRKTNTDLLSLVLLPYFLPVFIGNLLPYAHRRLHPPERVLILPVSKHFSRPRGVPTRRRSPICERNLR